MEGVTTTPCLRKHVAMATASAGMYHRWLGSHAQAVRRLGVGTAVGLAAGVGLSFVTIWQVAVLGGFDFAVLVVLVVVWPPILRADAEWTKDHALREDETRDSARLLLLTASSAALVAVGVALGLAKEKQGFELALVIAVSALAVVMSWTLVNTVFTLRYAHLHYAVPNGAIDFGDDRPDYRDFAYLAFTIGMTYQVSDTALRHRDIRRTVLFHAMLSYLYGVVIVATGVNVIAQLLGR